VASFLVRTFIVSALLIASIGAPPARAGNNYQCDNSGSDEATINACGARWRAANIRAHILARSNGNVDAACLTKTAELLERMATTWTATKTYTPFEGSWPCGSLPEIGGADDDVLSKACPGAVWSYENVGKPGCVLAAAPVPVASAAPVVSSNDGAGPSFDETMRWLAENLPLLSDYTLNGNPLHFHWQTRIAGSGCGGTLSIQYTTDGNDWHAETESDVQFDFGAIKVDELAVTLNAGKAPQISLTTRTPMAWSKVESGGSADNPKLPASSSGSTSSWNLIVADSASGTRIINALRRASTLCARTAKPQPF
jgi:hypothetical protein